MLLKRMALPILYVCLLEIKQLEVQISLSKFMQNVTKSINRLNVIERQIRGSTSVTGTISD